MRLGDMKYQPILSALCGTFLVFGCTNIEDFEIYPDLIDGQWRLAEAEFATNQDRDSCSFDGVMTFLPDGEFEREVVQCDQGQVIDSPIQGNWKFKEDGDILFVKERIRIGTSASLVYRNYSYDLAGDTLRLSEDFEEGIDRFVYVRE